jgi:hypothetical protein
MVRDLGVKVVQDGTHGTFVVCVLETWLCLTQHSPYGAIRKHQERRGPLRSSPSITIEQPSQFQVSNGIENPAQSKLLHAPIRGCPSPLCDRTITNLTDRHPICFDHSAPQIPPHLIQLFPSLLLLGPEGLIAVESCACRSEIILLRIFI